MFTLIVQCSDPDIDIIATCGMGATSCVGTMRNPVCECDHTMHYVAAGDRKSCLLGRNVIRYEKFSLLSAPNRFLIAKRAKRSFIFLTCSSALEG